MQPSPAFHFSQEQIDYVNFVDDLNTNWPQTPLPLPEAQPLDSNNFSQEMDENWTCKNADSGRLFAQTDLEDSRVDVSISADLGNLGEEVDMTTSTPATSCQSPLGPPILPTQSGEHSYQTLPQDEMRSRNKKRRAIQTPPAGASNSSLPANQQIFPDLVGSLENQISPKKTEMSVRSAARSVLRTDYQEYLEAELPRWAKGGLWDHEPRSDSQPVTADPDYYELQVAYSDVCQLHTWMGDDMIRSRMALIRLHLEYQRTCESWQARRGKGRIGRGDATCIIDHILQKTHHDWPNLSKTQCSTLRARFHERKRYGKRWAVLADGLGKSILFLCSPKVAAIV